MAGVSKSSITQILRWHAVLRKEGKHQVIAPLPVDFQVFPQVAFALKTGLFKEPDASGVLGNTGCFDTVQLKARKDVGNSQFHGLSHVTLAGETLAHPVADHAALRRAAADIAD